jgi:hypothetical protein
MNNEHTQRAGGATHGNPGTTPFRLSASRRAFIAALSVYAASGPLHAEPRLATPNEVRGVGLQYDFRCEPGAVPDCPIEADAYDLPALDFPPADQLAFSGAFTPPLVNDTCLSPTVESTEEGVGILCGPGSSAIGDASLEAGEALVIDVCDTDGGSCASASIISKGVYLSGVNAVTVEDNPEAFGSDTCESDFGEIEVFFPGGSSDSYFWSAPQEFSEGGEGCVIDGEQTIFVPFPFIGTDEIERIEVRVEELLDPNAGGVFVLATEDCSGGTVTFQGACEINLYEGVETFENGDLRVVAPPEAVIELVDGFPIRVRDTRPICQQGADPGSVGPALLPVDGSLAAGAYKPGPGTDAPELIPPGLLPLTVSTHTGHGMPVFTLDDKTCGIPRTNANAGASTSEDPEGVPIARATETPVDDPVNGAYWTPFFDVVAIRADFDPRADTTEFISSDLDAGDQEYSCQEAALGFSTPGTADEDQPLFQINARPDEIKYVAGIGSPIVDPVGRDIMNDCGSKRAISRRWSYLAYNVIHAPEVDFVAETADEINTLVESVARLTACLDPVFYATEVQPSVARGSRYYGIFERYRSRSTRIAERYLDRAEDAFRDALFNVQDSSGDFLTCWSTASSGFVEITATEPPPGSLDKPLNAYGDLLSQLEHLRYVFRAFRNKLLGI